jgi:hypothetical protein
MKQYHYTPQPDRPRHEPGELVWALSGNWVENPKATGKERPWVIVETAGGQDIAVGLTTQPRYATTGSSRPEVPDVQSMGLPAGRSYLWSSRTVPLCRLGVRQHIGWVTRELVELIAKHTHLAPHVIERLRDIADRPHQVDDDA